MARVVAISRDTRILSIATVHAGVRFPREKTARRSADAAMPRPARRLWRISTAHEGPPARSLWPQPHGGRWSRALGDQTNDLAAQPLFEIDAHSLSVFCVSLE
jgi:hypothetical protein